MGFWQTLGSSAAEGLGYGVGGLAAGFLGSKYASGRRRSTTSMVRDARMAHDLESEALHRRDMDAWNRAQSRGATVSEFYGGAAAGGSPAPQGTAAVLGNQRQQEQALEQSMVQDNINNALNRSTQMGIANIQADAQRDVAKIAAGASEYSTDTQAETARKALEVKKDELENVIKPRAAAELKISKKKLNLIANQIATSEPKFVEKLKIMSMGPDNVYVQAYMEANGLTDLSSLVKMSEKAKKDFIDGLIAYKSAMAGELAGLARYLGLDDYEDDPRPPHKDAGNKEYSFEYTNPFFSIKKSK